MASRMGLLLSSAILASCASQPTPPPEPLKDPIRVREVLSTSELVLEDGRRIRLEIPFSRLDQLKGRSVEVIALYPESDGFVRADLIIATSPIICTWGRQGSAPWNRTRLSEVSRLEKQDPSAPKGAVGRIGRHTTEFLDRALAVDVSPDGSTLLLGREDGSIELWDLEKLTLLRVVLPRPATRVAYREQRAECVRFLPDGERALVAGSEMGVRLLKVRERAEMWRVEGEGPCAVSPDAKTFASASRDEIVIRKIETGEEIRRLKGHLRWISSLAYSADGRSMYSGSYDTSARKWDLESGREVWRNGTPSASNAIGPSFPDRIRVSPSGKRVAVSYHGCWELMVKFLASDSGSEECETPVGSSDDFVFTGNADVIAHHDYEEWIVLFDPDAKKATARSSGKHLGRVFAMARMKDGRIISAGDAGNVLIWDPATFEPLESK